MTTKRYLSDVAFTPNSGTLPSAEQDAQSASFTASTAATLRTLTANPTTVMTSVAATTTATTSNQSGFMGMWALSALSGSQTIGGTGETITVNVADAESNLSANFCINRAHVYVWRPSNNTKVGDCCSYSTSPSGGSPAEATSADSPQVTTFTVDLSSVSASDGDVIIVELWANITQAAASAYSVGLYYGGSTEQTVENTVVSDHAAFVEFSQTFTFKSVDARLTSQSVSAIYSESTTTPSARLTGQSVSAIYTEGTAVPYARLTGQSALAIYSEVNPAGIAYLTSQSVLIIYEPNAADGQVSSLQLEVMGQEPEPILSQSSSLQLEILCSNTDIRKRPRLFVNT